MKISELSRATGVDVDTIRYDEKAGLLPAPAREANGYRSYGPAHLERLAFVRHCRGLRVRARLKSLRALERQLAALRSSCNSDHSTHECGILHELVAAAHGEACACHGEGQAR